MEHALLETLEIANAFIILNRMLWSTAPTLRHSPNPACPQLTQLASGLPTRRRLRERPCGHGVTLLQRPHALSWPQGTARVVSTLDLAGKRRLKVDDRLEDARIGGVVAKHHAAWPQQRPVGDHVPVCCLRVVCSIDVNGIGPHVPVAQHGCSLEPRERQRRRHVSVTAKPKISCERVEDGRISTDPPQPATTVRCIDAALAPELWRPKPGVHGHHVKLGLLQCRCLLQPISDGVGRTSNPRANFNHGDLRTSKLALNKRLERAANATNVGPTPHPVALPSRCIGPAQLGHVVIVGVMSQAREEFSRSISIWGVAPSWWIDPCSIGNACNGEGPGDAHLARFLRSHCILSHSFANESLQNSISELRSPLSTLSSRSLAFGTHSRLTRVTLRV